MPMILLPCLFSCAAPPREGNLRFEAADICFPLAEGGFCCIMSIKAAEPSGNGPGMKE